MSKKLIWLVCLSAGLVLLSSCFAEGPRRAMRSGSSEKRADARTQAIGLAIKDKNKEAFKEVFSKRALEEAEDMDAQIDALFDFFEGEVVSWKRDGYSSSGATDYGKRTQMVFYDIIITTDKDEFKLYVTDYGINTRVPDNEGVYMLEMYREWDAEWSLEERLCAGVHEPLLARTFESDEDIPDPLDMGLEE